MNQITSVSGDGTGQKSGQLPTQVHPEGPSRRDEASPITRTEWKGIISMKTRFSDADIKERRAEYAFSLRYETQASESVREAWRKLVAMLDELLRRRK